MDQETNGMGRTEETAVARLNADERGVERGPDSPPALRARGDRSASFKFGDCLRNLQVRNYCSSP